MNLTQYIGKMSECETFKQSYYVRKGNDNDYAIQSACRNFHLCQHCAKSEQNKRADKWLKYLRNCQYPLYHIVLTASKRKTWNTSTDMESFLRISNQYLSEIDAIGIVSNLHLFNKETHEYNLHSDSIAAIKGRDATPKTAIASSFNRTHFDLITSNLRNVIWYMWKYPIQDFLWKRNEKPLTREFLDIISEYKKIQAWRATGIFSTKNIGKLNKDNSP